MSGFKQWLIGLTPIYKLLVAIAFIIGLYHGFLYFLDWRIETRIREDSFIREIADNLRPFVIFDEEGTILYDEGGMKHIKNIEVLPGKDGEEPQKIIVSPREPLKREPILHCLNDRFQITRSKTKPFDHVFELGSPMFLRLEVEFAPSVEITSWRFKLEILR